MANQVQTVPVENGGAVTPPQPALSWFRSQLERLGIERIVVLAVAVLALIGLFAFIALKAIEPRYTVLYAGMALDDTRTVVQRLEAMGVAHRLSPQGDAVMVPADRVLELRMALAADGLPGGGVVGYEIFDTTDSFGTTEFLSNINLKRAMEGELARTIQSLRSVRTARVHLVQPRRELFRRDQAPASASVFLSVGPGGLGRGEIASIRHLVAAAVPGLEADRITIADDQGRLLARGGDSSDGLVGLDDTESYRAVFEGRLQEKILQLLERSVGTGRVEAQVTAELDFDNTTTTEEIFDPERQVVRSTQIIDETTELDEREPNDRVTVADNLPGGDAEDNAATSREARARTEETINYEVSRIVRNQTRRGGRLERLSVAVQVDGTYRTNEAGEVVFEPLPAAELAELEELVRSAVGIDDARGDTLSIVSRRLATPEPRAGEAPEALLGLEREDWFRLAEIGGLLLVALLILFFGVRPLFKRLAKADAKAEIKTGGPRLLTAPDGKQLLVHLPNGPTIKIDENGRPMLVGPDGEPIPEPEEPVQERISLKHIEGSVNASMLTEMSDLIKNRPEDAIRVIRSWLHQN
jgi:flagellar M-ring protein FliF